MSMRKKVVDGADDWIEDEVAKSVERLEPAVHRHMCHFDEERERHAENQEPGHDLEQATDQWAAHSLPPQGVRLDVQL